MADEHTDIPPNHIGQHYIDFMSRFSEIRGTLRYLEIGVNQGHLMSRVAARTAVAVDPNFIINANVAARKDNVFMYQVTSDAFFKDKGAVASLGGPPDIAFLDGMHLFEFLLRDFYNTEAMCDHASLIVMHDCLPLNEAMANRDMHTAMKLGEATKFPQHWTGDVWKIVPILQKYRPDLRLTFVDCPPTGLVFVSGLDSRSTVLRDKYYEIVDEFKSMQNDLEDIGRLYKSVKIISSHAVLNGFDYSLYFLS